MTSFYYLSLFFSLHFFLIIAYCYHCYNSNSIKYDEISVKEKKGRCGDLYFLIDRITGKSGGLAYGNETHHQLIKDPSSESAGGFAPAQEKIIKWKLYKTFQVLILVVAVMGARKG